MFSQNSVGAVVVDTVKQAFDSHRLVKPLFLAGLVGLGSGLIVFVYRWNRINQEQAAQKVFADCVQAYQKASEGNETWDNVQDIFKYGYARHDSSVLAPYFLFFQADVALRLKDQSAAQDFMNRGIEKIDSTASLYPWYYVKHLLIRIDAGVDGAAEELATFAERTGNDYALYYAGLHAASENNNERARQHWQQLMDSQDAYAEGVSPWKEIVEKKLEQIA